MLFCDYCTLGLLQRGDPHEEQNEEEEAVPLGDPHSERLSSVLMIT